MTVTKIRLLEKVKEDLEAIEEALRSHLNPYLDLVARTAGHLLFAGGKRFRPLLMVLCARVNGYQGNSDKKFSTAFEYLHAATLLHDDVVDGARLRRSHPAAHRIWGIPTTVLVGDFLLARALAIGAETGKLKVIEVLADITGRMAQGEIHQLAQKGDMGLTEAVYLDIITNKTAVLIQGACRVGAIIADAPENREQALGAYGYHLGMAFQMIDDLLDYGAQTATLGKVTGAVIREGKLTLPLIHLLQRANPAQRSQIQAVMGQPDFSDDAFKDVVAMMDHYGSLAYVAGRATVHVEKAKAALDGFAPSPTRDLLLEVADYVVARHH
jgi:octaprenyl-diphosphate synthase